MLSCKRQGNLNRPSRKRGGKRISPNMTAVLVSVDRKGNLLANNMPDSYLKRMALDRQLAGKFSKNAILCSDGHPGYRGLAQREELVHEQIDPTKSMTLKEHVYHIQTVNAMHHQIRDLIG